MSRKFNIEMIFYSHPWSIHMLKDMGIVDSTTKTVIVEVNNEPCLSVVCPDRNVSSFGTLPLLRRPIKSELLEMARSYSLIPAPIILAPNPPTSIELLVDSILTLDNKTDDVETVILACHIAHAEKYAALFPICDSFKFVWDTADYPSAQVQACIASLTQSGCLSEEKWGGFHYSNHWLRTSDDAETNQNIIQHLTSEARI